jgi:hypothetical protein
MWSLQAASARLQAKTSAGPQEVLTKNRGQVQMRFPARMIRPEPFNFEKV